MEIQEIKNICCIGAGHVGGPTMAVIAKMCPQKKVNVIDINASKINSWNSVDLEDLPVFEPGLKEIIKKVRDKNLFFTTDIETSIKEADMIFISVNTPIKTRGIGAGFASDLKWVESSARAIGRIAKGHTIVVEKSTLPVKTAKTIKIILESSIQEDEMSDIEKSFTVLSNPEFLSEGNAIDDLLNPDRVLIGGEDSLSIELLEKIYLNWVPKKKIIKTNLWSSELTKLSANAILAQRISSINSISEICESTGADIIEVSKAIGSDNRIGLNFLNAGPGFGGSCFKKDILNLVYLCRYYGMDKVADYWEQVIKINLWQQKRIYRIIVERLFGTVSGKKVAILGFAFKANTNDTRESPAIDITKSLLEEGAIVTIHDPKVEKEKVLKDLESFDEVKLGENNKESTWSFTRDISKAVFDSDAIILITEWDEYRNLSWKDLLKETRSPCTVFDTRSIINSDDFKNLNATLWRIGYGFV